MWKLDCGGWGWGELRMSGSDGWGGKMRGWSLEEACAFESLDSWGEVVEMATAASG